MKTDFPLIFKVVSPAKQLLQKLLRFNQYLIIIEFIKGKQTCYSLNERQDNRWISYICYGFNLIFRNIF